MAKTKTKTYDAVAYLKTPEDCAAYLEAVIEESNGEQSMITAALGEIGRAQGMMQMADSTGLAREALYRSLSATGNPSFATVLKVLTAMGLQISVKPA
jgi:probable addiction module antidote protein